MKNEKTSKRVAAIAGRMLEGAKKWSDNATFFCGDWFTVAELKALAASALTQAPDKPKKKNPNA